MKCKQATYVLVAAVLVLVLALSTRVYFGFTKESFHVDEGITLALTNGNWAPGMDVVTKDAWISGEVAKDMTFNATIAERGSPDIKAIAISTAHDVHPPLYYWLFGYARTILGVHRSVTAGYVLNLALFMLSCVFFVVLVRRIWSDPVIIIAALACFALSSAAVSLSVFLRMYELLQTVCLGLLLSAHCVLFPSVKAEQSVLSRSLEFWLGLVGLFACALAGFLTQYYFLFFVAPVCAFALVWLLVQKRPGDLFWGIVAVLAAFYLADMIFPPMKAHLTESYRAKQSIQNFASAAKPLTRLGSVLAYIGIISRNLVPLAVLVAGIGLAVWNRIASAKKIRKEDEAQPVSARVLDARYEAGSTALFLFIFLTTFSIIAVSAPYQTVRYVAAFFPVYVLAFTGLMRMVLSSRQARVLVAAAALLIAIHGLQKSNLLDFHEDYTTDTPAYYMTDEHPLIMMGTIGGTWKTPLVYVNIASSKDLYVTGADYGANLSRRLDSIADEIVNAKGGNTVYALVCDYFENKPGWEEIGYYGFYWVFKKSYSQ